MLFHKHASESFVCYYEKPNRLKLNLVMCITVFTVLWEIQIVIIIIQRQKPLSKLGLLLCPRFLLNIRLSNDKHSLMDRFNQYVNWAHFWFHFTFLDETCCFVCAVRFLNYFSLRVVPVLLSLFVSLRISRRYILIRLRKCERNTPVSRYYMFISYTLLYKSLGPPISFISVGEIVSPFL